MPLYTYTVTLPAAPVAGIFNILTQTNCVLSPAPPNGYFLDGDQIEFNWPTGTTDAYMCLTRVIGSGTTNKEPFVGFEGKSNIDLFTTGASPLTIRGDGPGQPFTGSWGFSLFFITNSNSYRLPDPIIEVKPS